MKKFTLIIMVIVAIQLSGCFRDISPLGSRPNDLENARGVATDCKGDILSKKPPYPSAVEVFWKDNNLPKGTNEFICKDGKAYLPEQVTDCQGNIIAKQAGRMSKFLQTNHIEDWGTITFICQNGKPVQWQNKSE